jgi:hypothetical protein
VLRKSVDVWDKQSERARRYELLVTFPMISPIIGSLVSCGFLAVAGLLDYVGFLVALG